MSPRNASSLNHERSRWEPKCDMRCSTLRSTRTLVERDVGVRPTEIAVALHDLVLEDEMVPEGVVGQVRDEPVVLVPVVAVVREDDVGPHLVLERLEVVLDLDRGVREVAVAERQRPSSGTRDVGRGGRARCAAPRSHGRPSPERTTQVIRSMHRSSSHCRIVPLQPISRSSLCAPRQSSSSPRPFGGDGASRSISAGRFRSRSSSRPPRARTLSRRGPRAAAAP